MNRDLHRQRCKQALELARDQMNHEFDEVLRSLDEMQNAVDAGDLAKARELCKRACDLEIHLTDDCVAVDAFARALGLGDHDED